MSNFCISTKNMCALMFCVFQNEQALHKLKGENANPFNNLNIQIINRYIICTYKRIYSSKIGFPRLPSTYLKTTFENVKQIINIFSISSSNSGLLPICNTLSYSVLSNCQVILATQFLFYSSDGSVYT